MYDSFCLDYASSDANWMLDETVVFDSAKWNGYVVMLKGVLYHPLSVTEYDIKFVKEKLKICDCPTFGRRENTRDAKNNHKLHPKSTIVTKRQWNGKQSQI